MEENLAYHRRSYEKSVLEAEELTAKPMEFFKIWFDEVEKALPESENNAMTLSTIDAEGFPENRIVLLKKFNSKGFEFFTNYTSTKGKSINANPLVAISFFWPGLERQVLVKGKAEKLSEEESDTYFATRPRGSQLGAWVSHQSEAIENREVLEDRKLQLEKDFDGKPIPRPEFWGGFRVVPQSVEFWQGRPNRLHDRFRYDLVNEEWKLSRLSP